ncbi:MAG TPA: hypothetical protein VM076_03155 [Gemmatimonadaceae bacterium]|nr:hypothetical protein [Gemmatimonadaceae bacterium]
MWDEDIVVPIAFFVTAIVISIGIPLIRAIVRRMDRQGSRPALPADTSDRLERIEQAIEAMSIEVERIAEGQRFVTRIMADKSQERVALPLRGDDRNS